MTQDTRKTWRDLPPEPPFGEVPAAPPRPEPPLPPPPAPLGLEAEAPRDRRRWAVLWVPLALLALALAIGWGVWALFLDGDDADVASDGGVPTTATVDPAAGLAEDPAVPPPDLDTPFVPDIEELLPREFLDRFGRNFFDEFGPELQIPDELLDQFPEFFFEEFGRDFFGDGGPGFGFGFGEDFEGSLPPELADQLRELRRFFDDFAGDNPAEEFGDLFDALPPDLRGELPEDMPERFSQLFDRLVPGATTTIGGVSPTYLPDGFRVASASVQQGTGAEWFVEIGLTGPGGPIAVRVVGGDEGRILFEAPGGEDTVIAGEPGREHVTDDTRTLTYRKDGATVIITAPEAFDRAELLRVGAGLEIDR